MGYRKSHRRPDVHNHRSILLEIAKLRVPSKGPDLATPMRRPAPPVYVHLLCKVLGTRRDVVRYQADEFVSGSRKQRLIEMPLLADCRETLRAYFGAAQRSCCVGGKNLRIIPKCKKLVVKTAVQQCREFLGRCVDERSGRPTSPTKSVSPVRAVTAQSGAP
jgi:hypothetical protein